MADSPRIEELRRRIDNDPASILFAQLADELRRAGHLDEAVRVSRSGLARYPAYLSARVTLARALMDLQQYDAARSELDRVLTTAPDNLSAIRSLSELQQRQAPAASPPPDDDEVAVLTVLEEWLLAVHEDRRARRLLREPVEGV